MKQGVEWPELVGTGRELFKIIWVSVGGTLMGWGGVADLLRPWSGNPEYVTWMAVPFFVLGPVVAVIQMRNWVRARMRRARLLAGEG